MRIDVSDLVVCYPEFTLGPITFSLDSGDFVSLIGPNGSGKSTLIRGILGLRRLATGGAFLDGRPIPCRHPRTLTRIGYLTDSADDLLLEFSPAEYWEYVRLCHERASGTTRHDALGVARRLGERLGLPVTRKPLSALSLGTRRKAQICAVLMTEPDVILLDEPFIGLDFISARALEQILHEEVLLRGAAVLCSSHDLTIASRISTRALVIFNGRSLLDQTLTPDSASELEASITAALAQETRC